MQQSTPRGPNAPSTLLNAEQDTPNNSNSSTELLHIEPIENTPLQVVGNEENGYFVAMGRYRLTKSVPKIEWAKDLLNTEQWNIIMNLIAMVFEIESQKK